MLTLSTPLRIIFNFARSVAAPDLTVALPKLLKVGEVLKNAG
jgi:hypothetical protein